MPDVIKAALTTDLAIRNQSTCGPKAFLSKSFAGSGFQVILKVSCRPSTVEGGVKDQVVRGVFRRGGDLSAIVFAEAAFEVCRVARITKTSCYDRSPTSPMGLRRAPSYAKTSRWCVTIRSLGVGWWRWRESNPKRYFTLFPLNVLESA